MRTVPERTREMWVGHSRLCIYLVTAELTTTFGLNLKCYGHRGRDVVSRNHTVA